MAAPPAPRKGKGPLFWVLTGCFGCLAIPCLIGLVFAAAMFFITGGAVDAASGQLAELRRGELDKAYARVSDSFRSEECPAAPCTLEDFSRFVAARPVLLQHSDASFWPPHGSVSVDNDKARLRGALSLPTGETQLVNYELQKEAGSWKVTAIQTDGG
jgi:hypothetical protein